ncbi:tetratricopeptide repeat protein [Phenylobacterium sp. J367]|uniref:tetratricopeptide repeat protein n=1 Tax=Phenylobacterium sp. J367 TaxID=2898435 RepID=UPI00215172EB|nr:tetratricopeptide repeat protein [Phenylobacterium sp. J367]MCR5879978.1 tetratricopeptide repeat protein [Phenylobacterium sp. J367]
MRRFLLAAAAPLVLLSACASDPAGRRAPETYSLSPYGMFLAGQAALNDGRSDDAARFFAQANAHADTDVVVGERAFTAAVLAGDIEKAVQIAPTGPQVSEATNRLARLTEAVEHLADGKGKPARELLTGDDISFPHRGVAALLAPWAAAMAGDTEGSLVRPQVRGDRIVDYFGQLGRASLFERARRYDEAETDFKAAASTASSEMAILAYGGFLERRNRRPDAIVLYDTLLAQEPMSLPVAAARARAAAGKAAPPALTLRQGAAQAMLAPAATMLQAKQTQLSLVYLRLALRLDPDRDQAWVMVGDIMQTTGDSVAARAAYAKPKPGSPEYAGAQAKLAWTYQSDKDPESALRLARAAAASGDVDARMTLADLLRANEHYGEAVEVLGGLIQGSKTPDWRLYYSRGVAFERLGRWPEAETDLQAALKLRPDEPELLNYLGYTWIDRGERLPEAMAMVEKAVAANPRSGAMIDSLGWAHYRMGDFKKAVERLEQAVELEAGDPEINNHLGDAYWMVGRKDEAVFQWRRVLTLDPDARIKADVEAKLASGLGPKRQIAGQ